MATPEMRRYYTVMTKDMGEKLSGYYMSLQNRFGDPRVYAAQAEEIRAQEAALQHRKSQKVADLLRDAYEKKQASNRGAHEERMSKRRDRQTASKRPQS